MTSSAWGEGGDYERRSEGRHHAAGIGAGMGFRRDSAALGNLRDPGQRDEALPIEGDRVRDCRSRSRGFGLGGPILRKRAKWRTAASARLRQERQMLAPWLTVLVEQPCRIVASEAMIGELRLSGVSRGVP